MECSKTSLLQSYFDFVYAKEISLKMYSVFRKKCVGCQHSRLSQLDHTCLKLTEKQQLELYFEDVLREIDESNILLKWSETVSSLDVPSALLDMYKLKIYCRDWRETDMKTNAWRHKMIRLVIQLILLENRFQ